MPLFRGYAITCASTKLGVHTFPGMYYGLHVTATRITYTHDRFVLTTILAAGVYCHLKSI